MNSRMWKTHNHLTHNLTHNHLTHNQTQTRRGNKTETHRLLHAWHHWGALAHLLEGRGHLRNSLADALDTITNTIFGAQGALYNITSYRESRRKYYSDRLTHNDIKALKITKDQLLSLFRDPSTGLVPPTSRAHISIDWCIEPNINANWMDRWYMVFDEDPHGNSDIPFISLGSCMQNSS